MVQATMAKVDDLLNIQGMDGECREAARAFMLMVIQEVEGEGPIGKLILEMTLGAFKEGYLAALENK